MEILEKLGAHLQKGETDPVVDLTNQALEQGLDPKVILDNGLIAGMAVVGQQFKEHKIFLPHVLLAARSMQAAVDILKPLLAEEGIPSIGKVVIGTVQGDQHDIGKNLVGIMLKGAGVEVIDLGKDISPEAFVDTAEKEEARIIGMSALLTTTMPVMRQVVDLVHERGLNDKIRVIIGGAPVNDDYAKEIGADAYCYDGVNAVDRVKSLLGVA
jgi:5-methyltetrahydrofolate--homocysteine methyltransferase